MVALNNCSSKQFFSEQISFSKQREILGQLVFVQLDFSSNRVVTDKKSSWILIILKKQKQVFIQKTMAWLKPKWN